MKKTIICVGLLAALIALPMASWAETGADVFKAKCAMCHGDTGKKMPGTHDWSTADVQKMSDAELTKIITDGQGKMPPQKAKVTDAQVKELVTYIRSLKK